MRQRSQDSPNTAEKNDKNLSFDSSIHIISLIFIHEFKVSLSRILLLLTVSLSGILSLKKSKWLRVSSLSNLPVSTVLLLNKSINGKKWWLPLEPKDFESQRSCSFRGMTMDLKSDESIYCAHVWHVSHICVCDLSTVSDCLFSLCRTSPPVYLQTETMATCQSWYVLLTPICHHQSSSASSLHLERKRDGNQRRRTWQWGFQQKALRQSNGASCVIKSTKLPSVTGCKWSALVKMQC